MIAITFISLLIASVYGHMCLLSPYQRGGRVSHADINTQGADPCGLTTGPCGGVNASNSEMTAFATGETITVVMQKNLDHYVLATPGNFTAILRSHNETTKPFTLGTIADDKDESGAIYQIVGTIPETDEGPYILQAIYYTNNAQAPAAFYQCADIRVHKPSR